MNKAWDKYDITMKLTEKDKEKIAEKIITEAAIAEQTDTKITNSQYRGEAIQYENSLQLIHYPFMTERNKELNTYLINVLDESNRQKINLLKSTVDINFSQGIVFWCLQIIGLIVIFIGFTGSLLGKQISIPGLGKVFQFVFGFIK